MRILSTHPTLRLIACEAGDVQLLAETMTGLHGAVPSWVTRLGDDRFHVLLASQGGRVVGYIAMDAHTGDMDVVGFHVSTAAENRQIIEDYLVDTCVEAANTAWGNVHLDPSCEALGSFLRDGWMPVSTDPHAESPRLALTGAAVQ